MISALKKLSQTDAQHILVAIARDFLPVPEKESTSFDDPERAAIRSEVLREVRRRLGLQPDDRSPRANAQILDFISGEIGGYTTAPMLEDKIRARLGERGDLRPDQYDIKFSQEFDDVSAKRGMRRSQVREVLLHPDNVQHLTPRADIFETKQGEEISLYSKTFGATESRDEYTVLVTARRRGYTLTVTSAWHVFHADVNLRDAQTPLDILKAFADIYGVPFQVGKSAPKKLYLHEVVPLADGQESTNVFSVPTNVKPIEAEMLFRVTPLKVAEVRAAFAIDTAKYVADLQKHGIEARI